MAKRNVQREPMESFSKSDYETLLPTLEALREEVSFVLRDDLDSQGIKVHVIESRVKAFSSWKEKLIERLGDDETEIEDMVGARVVCLFKSDIDKLDQRISELFVVIKRDDKVNNSDDSFGYMSVHYICTMKESYRGPRYNRIKGLKFEIQVRTLCMHAWAAISHYLDYKSEWDIPEHLRKGLNALSGLFYVADEQYERLYDARQDSRKQADEHAAAKPTGETAINLDTISAYANSKFPDRRTVISSEVSNLVQELNEAGYSSIAAVDADVQAGMAEMLKDEEAVIVRQKEKHSPYFSQGGAIRVALSFSNPIYKDVMANSAKRRFAAKRSSK